LDPEIGINEESQAARQYNTILHKQTISQKTCPPMNFMVKINYRNPVKNRVENKGSRVPKSIWKDTVSYIVNATKG
jgi:hypothetical protein